MFSSKIASWLAIVATVCFIVLITLQVLELMHYSGDPSAWPKL
ncbi:MAG TPA: hypothetical protein PLE77_11180 [Kiritimatiellia bacterium]|nr:hypothetical protein [Kiritimatiellia bacterium]